MYGKPVVCPRRAAVAYLIHKGGQFRQGKLARSTYVITKVNGIVIATESGNQWTPLRLVMVARCVLVDKLSVTVPRWEHMIIERDNQWSLVGSGTVFS